jgi:hypothetical protein
MVNHQIQTVPGAASLFYLSLGSGTPDLNRSALPVWHVSQQS